MADIFVNSNAVGLNDGTTWANAYITFALAVTASISSDRIIIATVHSESIGVNTTYTLAGNNLIISSTVSGTNTITYQKAAAPQISSSANISLAFAGNTSFFNGVWVEGGKATGTPDCLFYECTIKCGTFGNPGSSSVGPVALGTSSEYNYCDISNESTNSVGGVVVAGNRTVVEMLGGSISSSRITENANHSAFGITLDASIVADGVDCSGFQTDNLLRVVSGVNSRARITRTRLNANTTTLSTLTATEIGCDITIEAVDSANTVNRRYRVSNQGQLFSDSTIKLSNVNFSHSNKIETNATASEFFNAVRFLIATDHADFSTAKTINIEVAQDGTTTGLTDSELWFEIIYPDDLTSSYLVDSSRAADNQSSAVLTTSIESWDGLSGTNVKQKVSLATTQTGKEGSFEIYACLSKTSSSAYVTVNGIA